MLRLFKRKPARSLRIVADPSATYADLQARNLLDDPDLRLAMGLDPSAPEQIDHDLLDHAVVRRLADVERCGLSRAARYALVASSSTSSIGNIPRHAPSTSPEGDNSAAAGWPVTPNAVHDSNVSSQYIGNE